MRVTVDGTKGSLVAVLLLLQGSACFDGGDYRGGGRRIEAPTTIDAAEGGIDDSATPDDASPEDGDVSDDEVGAAVGTAPDAPSDTPRTEPDLEDGGRDEPDGAPADGLVLDVMTVEAGIDAPPGWPDAAEPKDTAIDAPSRDAPSDARRD